jgi:hypothetical protein
MSGLFYFLETRRFQFFSVIANSWTMGRQVLQSWACAAEMGARGAGMCPLRTVSELKSGRWNVKLRGCALLRPLDCRVSRVAIPTGFHK